MIILEQGIKKFMTLANNFGYECLFFIFQRFRYFIKSTLGLNMIITNIVVCKCHKIKFKKDSKKEVRKLQSTKNRNPMVLALDKASIMLVLFKILYQISILTG